MNILIFTAQKELGLHVLQILKSGGYEAQLENIFETALKKFLQNDFELVVSDVPVHDQDLNFCRIAKLHKSTTRVVAISYGSGQNIAAGWADAQIEYPFSGRELLEKIEKFETKYEAKVSESLMLGDLEIHPNSYEAFRKGKKLRLRKKEFQLLEFLLRNKNRVINRHTILEYIWSYSTQAMTNTLDVHISSLRKKIDGDYKFKMLKTIHGAGYKLSDH